MDMYTKYVLTVIAVALIFIAAKLWEPQDARADIFGGAPTVGELMDLRHIQDPMQRKDAVQKVIRRIPLVRVHGSVDVDN